MTSEQIEIESGKSFSKRLPKYLGHSKPYCDGFVDGANFVLNTKQDNWDSVDKIKQTLFDKWIAYKQKNVWEFSQEDLEEFIHEVICLTKGKRGYAGELALSVVKRLIDRHKPFFIEELDISKDVTQPLLQYFNVSSGEY